MDWSLFTILVDKSRWQHNYCRIRQVLSKNSDMTVMNFPKPPAKAYDSGILKDS